MIGSPFAGDRMLFDDIISARFELRFERQRHVRPSVAVEVGVERGADQWMQLDRLFRPAPARTPDTEAVQRRRAISSTDARG
jgi:hypothetical protein